jgi:hypothetical protein
MYVFIDDSGDAGFKLDSGSSHLFVIACCVFESEEDAEHIANRVKQLRDELGRSSLSEFKFSKTKLELQKRFFNQLDPELFFIRSIVVDKTAIDRDMFQNGTESFYNLVIQLVLTNSGGTIQGATVKIDGSGSREYRSGARKYLLAEVNKSGSEFIRKVVYVRSHTDSLIQVADMFAGCIRRSSDKSDKNQATYKAMLAPFSSHTKSDFWKVP